MMADLGKLLHGLDQLVRQILGMGSHKTDALDAVNLCRLPQKLRKGDGHFQIFSVGVYILSKKHDLHHAVRRQFLNLPQDILRLAASLPPPHIGDNAVAAKIVAAKHDVNPRFKEVFSLRRKILHNLVRILPDIDDHLLRLQAAKEKLCEFINIVSAKDQIDKAVALFQLFHHRGLLHHAAAESDPHTRIFLFQAVKKPKSSVNLLVRVIPDCAGIVDHKIRVFVGDGLIAHLLQNTCQLLAVPCIHLTAHVDYTGLGTAAMFLCESIRPLPAFCHKIILPFRLCQRRLLGGIDFCNIYFIIHFSIFYPFLAYSFCWLRGNHYPHYTQNKAVCNEKRLPRRPA